LADIYGTEAIQPYFNDTIQGGTYGILSKLKLNDFNYVDEGIDFNYNYLGNKSKMLRIENYNTFAEFAYDKYGDLDENYNYSIDKQQFTIKTSIDNKTFSFPIKKYVLEYLNNNDKVEKNTNYQGENYTIIVKNFGGQYYEKQDSIALRYFAGYLFYNK
jgi:hypothetical protein